MTMGKKSTSALLNIVALSLFRQSGLGLIGNFFLIPVLLIVLAVGFFEGRKAYWDYRVREMCKRDGGVIINEKIFISAEQEKKLPKIDSYLGVAPEALAKSDEPAFTRYQRISIKEGNLSVARHVKEIVRRSDGRVVGQVISYGRGGGDFLSPAHPSTFSCPDYADLNKGIHEVFHIEVLK